MTDRPLLFLDVDGPLNPWAAKPHRRPPGYGTYRMSPESWVTRQARPRAYVKPLRVWLDPSHGLRLLALPYDLVWATTWGEEANEWIGPVVGLPVLPVVSWPASTPAGGVHWKTRRLVEYAAGRAFAWVDDEIGTADRAWVAERHAGRALLHRVDPRVGLLGEDFASLDAWA